MSKDYSHVPDWCRPGERVVDIGHEGSMLTVEIVKVHKRFVYATQPGSDYERKYRIGPTQIEAVKGSHWDLTRWLAPTTDPIVRHRAEDNRVKRIAGQVENLAQRWRRDRDLDAARLIARLLVEAGIIASYEPTEPES